MKTTFKDMTGKTIEVGHIVAVRYVWNSYVGEIGINGLHATGCKDLAFNSPHTLKSTSTHQILGHTDPAHPDYNAEIHNWYAWIGGECPIRITVYDNVELV